MDEIFDVCLEEVALEGLDGITLNAFWMRLENREPKFSLKLDVFSKTAIWERLSTSADVEFFKLPTARDLPTLPTEIRKQDPVTGIILVTKPAEEKNIYPAHSISSEKYGVFGSCSTYWARKNITLDIRNKHNTTKITLEEVVKRYGDTLVMVASQKVRMKALLGSETSPSRELTDAPYLFLEWIGRSRHYGVFQSDTLKELQIDHKTAYYYRNWLSQSGYVTSQQVLKQEDKRNFVRVNLVFLKRKTVPQPHSRYDLMSEDISKYLENTPHRIASMEDIKTFVQKTHKHVDYDMFRRNVSIMKQMGYLEKHMLPHQLVTGYSRVLVQNQRKEISVGCLRLVKVFRIETEEEEPEQDEYDIRDGVLYKGRSGVDQVHDFLSRSYLEDGKALMQGEIVQSLKLSKLYVRTLIRRLESQKAITSTLIDSGRQKTHVFLPVDHPRDSSKKPVLDNQSGSPGTSAASQSKEKNVNETGDSTPVAKVSINFSQARMEKRKGIMLQMIDAKKAILGLGQILKEVREREGAEGLKAKVDGKTLKRLLKKMTLLNEINEFSVDIGRTYKTTVYAAKEVTFNDPRVQSLITQEEFHRTGRTVKEPRPWQKIKLVAKEEADTATVVVKQEPKDEEEEKEDTFGAGTVGAGTVGAGTVRAGTVGAGNSVSDGSQWKDEKDAKPMPLSFEGGQSQILPRMPKMRLVHEFLWYIVYENPAPHRESHRKRKKDSSKVVVSNPKVPRRSTGDKKENTKTRDGWIVDDEETERVTDKSQEDNQELIIDEDEGDEDKDDSTTPSQTSSGQQEKISKHSGEKRIPTVYRDVGDWRRFVAPLPRREMVEGWFVLGDVIQRMPLSVFIQLTCQEHLLENVSEYLDNPVKMHYPINKLPKQMREKIHVNRSFIHKIEVCLTGLARFGLLWLGPQGIKIKEERSFFLCKKAKLKDTTSSDIDYMRVTDKDYPEIWYHFDSFSNVTKYWYDFMVYSLNTPLGVTKGPHGVSFGLRKKPEETLRGLLQIWESTSSKPDKEGNILGDGRGACGMDSSNFTHLKRNWIRVKIVPLFRSQINAKKIHKKDDSLSKAGTSKDVKRLKGLGSSANKTDGSFTRVSVGAGKTLQVPILKKQVSSEEYKKSKGGKGLKRKKTKESKPTKALKTSKVELKKRNTGDDELDKLARMRSKRQRCMWTPKEDNFILMCCITSAILDKKVKRLFMPWKEIRNILHERIEASRDKITTSISKRASYIFNYPQTMVNYSICLTEIYEDEALMSDFMSRQEDYTKPEVCGKEYRELLDIIIEKYRKKTTEDAMALTSLSFKDLLEKYDIVLANVVRDPRRYKLVIREDIKTQEDIQKAVIQSLILGALHSQRYPGYKPSEMFNVFCQYDASVLQDSFRYLRDISVISRKRHAQDLTINQLNRVMPHVPMSYQLSSVYNKFVFSKLSEETVSDASQFWTLIETSEKASVDIPLDPSGGCCAETLLFTALGLGTMEVTLPDQLIIVDLEASNKEGMSPSEKEDGNLDQESDNEDNDDEEDRGQDDDEEEEMEKEDAEILKLLSETQEGWSSSAQGLLQSDLRHSKGSRGHVSTLSSIPENSEERMTNEPTSQMDASTDSLAVPSTSNQNEKIEKGGIRKNDKAEMDAASTEDRTPVNALSIRHNLLILRNLIRPKLSARRLCHLPEEVVMNSCNLTVKVNTNELKDYVGAWHEDSEKQTLVEFLSSTNKTFVPFLRSVPLSKCFLNVEKWLPVETIDMKTRTWATFKQSLQPSELQVELEDLEKVYSFIGRGKFKGATMTELQEAFPNWQEFIKNVKILIREKMVLEVGLTQLRLVTIENVSDWVVKCLKVDRNLSDSIIEIDDSDEGTPMDEAVGSHGIGHQEIEKQKGTEADVGTPMDATGESHAINQLEEVEQERTEAGGGTPLETTGGSHAIDQQEKVEQERTEAVGGTPLDTTGGSHTIDQQEEVEQEGTEAGGRTPLDTTGGSHAIDQLEEVEQERTKAGGGTPLDTTGDSHNIDQQEKVEQERTEAGGGTPMDTTGGSDAINQLDEVEQERIEAGGGTPLDTTGGSHAIDQLEEVEQERTKAGGGTPLDTTGDSHNIDQQEKVEQERTEAGGGTPMDTTGGSNAINQLDEVEQERIEAGGGTPLDTTGGNHTIDQQEEVEQEGIEAGGGTPLDTTGGSHAIDQLEEVEQERTKAGGGTPLDTTGDSHNIDQQEKVEQERTEAGGGTPMDTTGGSNAINQLDEVEQQRIEAGGGTPLDTTGGNHTIDQLEEVEQERTKAGGGTPLDTTGDSHNIDQQEKVEQERTEAGGGTPLDTTSGSQAIDQLKEVEQEGIEAGGGTPLDTTGGSQAIDHLEEVEQETIKADGGTPLDATEGSHTMDQLKEVEQERTEAGESTSDKDQSFCVVISDDSDEEDQSGLTTHEITSEPETPRNETEGAVAQQSSGIISSGMTCKLSLFEELKTKEEKEKMYFGLVGRVFYKIDGTLNRKQVQEIMIRVAAFIVENPGCKEEEILHTLEPVFSHSDCLVMLQKLTAFGCISRHKTQQKRYKGPFAREGHGKWIIFYMPSVDCICRLHLIIKACQEVH